MTGFEPAQRIDYRILCFQDSRLAQLDFTSPFGDRYGISTHE